MTGARDVARAVNHLEVVADLVAREPADACALVARELLVHEKVHVTVRVHDLGMARLGPERNEGGVCRKALGLVEHLCARRHRRGRGSGSRHVDLLLVALVERGERNGPQVLLLVRVALLLGEGLLGVAEARIQLVSNRARPGLGLLPDSGRVGRRDRGPGRGRSLRSGGCLGLGRRLGRARLLRRDVLGRARLLGLPDGPGGSGLGRGLGREEHGAVARHGVLDRLAAERGGGHRADVCAERLVPPALAHIAHRAVSAGDHGQAVHLRGAEALGQHAGDALGAGAHALGERARAHIPFRNVDVVARGLGTCLPGAPGVLDGRLRLLGVGDGLDADVAGLLPLAHGRGTGLRGARGRLVGSGRGGAGGASHGLVHGGHGRGNLVTCGAGGHGVRHDGRDATCDDGTDDAAGGKRERRVRRGNLVAHDRKRLRARGDAPCASSGQVVVILEKFVESIIGIPFAIVDATGCMVCIGRLEGILSAKDEHFGDKTYKATNIANSVSDKSILDVDYVIEFDNIKFAYKEGENVLNDVSFKIKNGENIAIVGSSGGGKTTIFRLLCGLYHASAGTYKLYGMDINEWNIESARENMALVSQDTFLFPGTIEENIRYGNTNATHDEVVNACKDARIHDFIEGLADGYETVISEGGSQLSGGQRQRIAIARAILKNTPILLLDEPTSAIDEGTEQLIQDALDRLCKGKTSITIAHRLSTIKDADRIIVLQYGRIVETGTHKQLLDMGGVYAEMYAEG